MLRKKLKVFGVLLFISFLALSLTACDETTGDDSVSFNNLTLNVEGEGQILDEDNQVLVSGDGETETISVERFSSITLKASPKGDWDFVRWEDRTHSSDESLDLYISGDREVTAVFRKTNATKENPAKLNETAIKEIKDHWLHGNVTYEITMKDFIRGQEAQQILDEEVAIDRTPDDGHEWALLEFNIKATSVSDEPFTINSFHFEAVREDGTVYSDSGSDVGLNRSRISRDLYEGSNHTGWFYIQVEIGDNPWITYLRNVDDGNSWFVIE